MGGQFLHELLQKHALSQDLILRGAECSQFPVVLGEGEVTQNLIFCIYSLFYYFVLCQKGLDFGLASACLACLNPIGQPGNSRNCNNGSFTFDIVVTVTRRVIQTNTKDQGMQLVLLAHYFL